MKAKLRTKVLEAIAEMPVINHHEHARYSFSVESGMEYDLPFFLYFPYLMNDLSSAGLKLDEYAFEYLHNPEITCGSARVWEKIKPYLEHVRNTAYFRYLLRALEGLFGIREKDIFSERWNECSEKMREYSRRNKGKGALLCERMNIKATILDSELPPEEWSSLNYGRQKILHVVRLDMFISEEFGLPATLRKYPGVDFEGWLTAFDNTFRHALLNGAAGFKTVLAYTRRIEFGNPSKDEAARIFKSGILRESNPGKIIYQDFMVNRWCQLCAEADVPLQIHTGIQVGAGHTLEDTKPTLLTTLFQRHPELRVDLLHGGYPWYIQAGLLAKYFPNVYVNGCFLPQASPSAYRRGLTSWIETVPGNKIFAWGGDHFILEHTYASLLLAKDLAADVLTELVEKEYFDFELAIECARRMFLDNGRHFWKI